MNLFLLIFGGIAIGVMVAAPVGPVNLICIRRTLAFGRLNGFLSGTGAALGDGAFAIVVAFGLTAVSGVIDDYFLALQTFGGLLLLGMGVHTFLTNPRPFMNPNDVSLPERGQAGDLAGAVVSTFVLTVTNPATMLGFVGLFSWLFSFSEARVSETLTFTSAGILVASVVAGSALWWGVLTGLMGFLQGRLTFAQLRLLNRVTGSLIALLGIGVLVRLVLY